MISIIPESRITHEHDCACHAGFRCSCNRDDLAIRVHQVVVALVCAVLVILALLAAVLK